MFSFLLHLYWSVFQMNVLIRNYLFFFLLVLGGWIFLGETSGIFVRFSAEEMW